MIPVKAVLFHNNRSDTSFSVIYHPIVIDCTVLPVFKRTIKHEKRNLTKVETYLQLIERGAIEFSVWNYVAMLERFVNRLGLVVKNLDCLIEYL